jgi:hypothetical protein
MIGAVVKSTPLWCRFCGHLWRENVLYNVAVKVWTLHVRTIRCPECSAGYKLLSFLTEEAYAERVERGKTTVPDPERRFRRIGPDPVGGKA